MVDPNGVLAFMDCETTGLDPDGHMIWQLYVRRARWKDMGLRTVDTIEVLIEPTEEELLVADPEGLRINRFHEVYAERKEEFAQGWDEPTVQRVRDMLDRTTIVGAVPSFDTERMAKVLKRFGYEPPWHHRLVCVENLAAAKLASVPPWKPSELSDRLGVPRKEDTMHDARYDVIWAMNLFEAVYR